MTLGKNIKKHRDAFKFYAFGKGDTVSRVGMTQRELAERLGVARQTVSDWETDTNKPGSVTLRLIARVLGVTLEDLTGQKPAAEHTNGVNTYAACAARIMEANEAANPALLHGGDLLASPIAASDLSSLHDTTPEQKKARALKEAAGMPDVRTIQQVHVALENAPRHPERKNHLPRSTFCEKKAAEAGKAVAIWLIALLLGCAGVYAAFEFWG